MKDNEYYNNYYFKLAKIDKFRLLLNKAYDLMKPGKLIMIIQETMVTHSIYFDLALRGKYRFMPGTGNIKLA